MTKFSVELFFYKNNDKNSGLSEIPDLDNYKKETVTEYVTANDWNSAKEKILHKYPDVAYLIVQYTENLDI